MGTDAAAPVAAPAVAPAAGSSKTPLPHDVEQAIITVAHSPKDTGTVSWKDQLEVFKEDVVDVLHKDFEGQWWDCLVYRHNADGTAVPSHGKLPSGCMMVLQYKVDTKVLAERGVGFEREAHKLSLHSSQLHDKWKISQWETVKKMLGELKYDQWSKACFVCASFVVLMQCVLVTGWHYHEKERIGQGGVSEFARETRRYHVAVSVICFIALPVFFGFDRLIFGATPIPRCIFCWVMGVGLFQMHPTVLGGCCLIMTSLISFGAWKIKEKCKVYDRKLNALPVIDPLVDQARKLIKAIREMRGKRKSYIWKFKPLVNLNADKEGMPQSWAVGVKDWVPFSDPNHADADQHEDPGGEGEDILEGIYSDYLTYQKSKGDHGLYTVTVPIPTTPTADKAQFVDFEKHWVLGAVPKDATAFAYCSQHGSDTISAAFLVVRETVLTTDKAITHSADEKPHTSTGGLTETYREAARQDRLGKLFLVGAWMAVNTFLYIEAHIRTKNTIERLSLGLSTAAPIAKGMGAVLNFNCSLIAVPVLGAVLRYLHRARLTTLDSQGHVVYGKTLDYYIPVGKNVTFHRYVAWFTMVAATIHTMAHFVNYGKAAEATYAVFPHYDGVWLTGVIIILCQVCMYSAALETVRRSSFNAFWFSHHLFVVFWACLLYHGPVFYIWSAAPLITYFWSRFKRDQELDCHVILQEMVLEPPDVIKLTMRNKETDRRYDMFPYVAGQYVRINCPFIAPLEWHPFTISSGPETNTLTLHIKVTRPDGFTGQLKKLMDGMNTNGHRICTFYNTEQTSVGVTYSPFFDKPILRIDGPHSAPCQHICEYEVSMLFGAGIGLTPFSASLSSIVDHKWMRTSSPKSLYLYWSFRMSEYSMYSWFVKLLSQIRARYLGKKLTDREFAEVNLELNLYATRGFSDEEKEMMQRTLSITPIVANYDRLAPEKLLVIKNNPPASVKKGAGELRVYEGDVVELIGSCATEGISAWKVRKTCPRRFGPTGIPTDGSWRIKGFSDSSIEWYTGKTLEAAKRKKMPSPLPYCPRGYCIIDCSDTKYLKIAAPIYAGTGDDDNTALRTLNAESPASPLVMEAMKSVDAGDSIWVIRPECAEGTQSTGLFYQNKDAELDDVAHCRIIESGGARVQGATRGRATVGWVSADACEYLGERKPELKPAERHEVYRLCKGRPKYDQIFQSVLDAHQGTEIETIGVFCCGPMGKQLRAACNKMSKFADPNDPDPTATKIFKLHAEVF